MSQSPEIVLQNFGTHNYRWQIAPAPEALCKIGLTGTYFNSDPPGARWHVRSLNSATAYISKPSFHVPLTTYCGSVNSLIQFEWKSNIHIYSHGELQTCTNATNYIVHCRIKVDEMVGLCCTHAEDENCIHDKWKPQREETTQI
jgi:hypothetical protein